MRELMKKFSHTPVQIPGKKNKQLGQREVWDHLKAMTINKADMQKKTPRVAFFFF